MIGLTDLGIEQSERRTNPLASGRVEVSTNWSETRPDFDTTDDESIYDNLTRFAGLVGTVRAARMTMDWLIDFYRRGDGVTEVPTYIALAGVAEYQAAMDQNHKERIALDSFRRLRRLRLEERARAHVTYNAMCVGGGRAIEPLKWQYMTEQANAATFAETQALGRPSVAATILATHRQNRDDERCAGCLDERMDTLWRHCDAIETVFTTLGLPYRFDSHSVAKAWVTGGGGLEPEATFDIEATRHETDEALRNRETPPLILDLLTYTPRGSRRFAGSDEF